MADPLPRVDPFSVRVRALPSEGSVLLAARPGLGIATVLAHRPLRQIGGLTLPDGPAAVIVGGTTIVSTGPGAWLVLREGASAGWIDSLESEFGDHAAIADQSSAYAVLRLSGDGARRLLARGAFIDFHPDSFRAGSAAVTLIAHMGAVIWQRDDAPTYEMAVFRSYASTFWHWIETAASGYGARLGRAG